MKLSKIVVSGKHMQFEMTIFFFEEYYAVSCYQLTVCLSKMTLKNRTFCVRWKHPTPHLTLSKDTETSSAGRNPGIFKTFFAIQC